MQAIQARIHDTLDRFENPEMSALEPDYDEGMLKDLKLAIKELLDKQSRRGVSRKM